MITVLNFSQFRLVKHFIAVSTGIQVEGTPAGYPCSVGTKGIDYTAGTIDYNTWVKGKPFHNAVSPIRVAIFTKEEQAELVEIANRLGLTWASGSTPTTFNLSSIKEGDTRVVTVSGILAKGTMLADNYNPKQVIDLRTFKDRYTDIFQNYYADTFGIIDDSVSRASTKQYASPSSRYDSEDRSFKIPVPKENKIIQEIYPSAVPAPRKESKLRALLPSIVKVASDDVIYTMSGKIALKNAQGEHVRYNKDTQTIDREVMFTDFEVGKYCYEIPVTSIVAGDVIKHQGKYLQVLSKGTIGYQAIDLDTHQLITVLKTTIANLPQLSFFTKVVCLFDQQAAQNTGINPMLFLLSDDLENNSILPLFLLMGNGENNTQINAVLPMLLMASKEDGDANSLAMLMMLQQQGAQGFNMNTMLPLLLLGGKKEGKDSSMKTFAMMQMMQQQQGGAAQPFNPMMLAMLDGDSSMKDIMMLSMMSGGNNPFAPAQSIAPETPIVTENVIIPAEPTTTINSEIPSDSIENPETPISDTNSSNN